MRKRKTLESGDKSPETRRNAKRTATTDDTDYSNKTDNTPHPETCPVCLEQFHVRDTLCFPCSHKTCKTCFTKCNTCPLCRIDRNGNSDEDRRRISSERQESPRGRIVITRVPRGQVDQVVNFIGSQGTPFDTNIFSVDFTEEVIRNMFNRLL